MCFYVHARTFSQVLFVKNTLIVVSAASLKQTMILLHPNPCFYRGMSPPVVERCEVFDSNPCSVARSFLTIPQYLPSLHTIQRVSQRKKGIALYSFIVSPADPLPAQSILLRRKLKTKHKAETSTVSAHSFGFPLR